MYLKLITIFIGGLFLSTNLMAIELQNKPAPTVINKPSQDKLIKVPPEIHHHNVIFDDYSSGGTPYTPYKSTKGK